MLADVCCHGFVEPDQPRYRLANDLKLTLDSGAEDFTALAILKPLAGGKPAWSLNGLPDIVLPQSQTLLSAILHNAGIIPEWPSDAGEVRSSSRSPRGSNAGRHRVSC